jgi:ATP-dependent protease ClpP protease subunit
MGRRQRLRARRAIGAVVTDTGDGTVEMLGAQPGRSDRTQAARERNAGHQATCTCGAASRADNWFKIRNFVDQPNRAAIYIYEEIGYWGTTANEFVQLLNSLNVDYLDVHINSPGGEVDDGIAIFNAIRQHKAYVTVYIDSIAASAASFIAMSGDKVCISEFGQVMIHDAMGLSYGNEAETIEFAGILGRYSNNVAGIYAQRAGGTPEQWRDVMRAETWYTGAEAVTAGLCDEVHDLMVAADEAEPMAGRMTARWDLSLFNFRHKGREAAPPPPLTNHTEPVEPAVEQPPVVEPEAVAVTPEPDVPVPVDPDTPAAVDPPAEDVVADTEPEVVPEVIHEPSESVDLEPVADVTPEVVPDPIPVAASTDADTWAQLMGPLTSATPASSAWDDVFANLTKP